MVKYPIYIYIYVVHVYMRGAPGLGMVPSVMQSGEEEKFVFIESQQDILLWNIYQVASQRVV